MSHQILQQNQKCTIICEPNIINQFCEITYCSIHDFFCDSYKFLVNLLPEDFCTSQHIPIVTNVNKSNLVYFKYDLEKKLWKLFYDNQNEFLADLYDEFQIIESRLEKQNKYFAIMVDGHLQLLKYVTPHKDVYYYNFFHSYFDIKNRKIVLNTFCRESDLYVSIIYSIEEFVDQFNDIMIPTKESIICLNPTSYTDSIFAVAKISQNATDKFTPKIIQNFKTVFGMVKNLSPIQEYKQIYYYFSINDKEYYSTKIVKFQTELLEIFKKFDACDKLDDQKAFITKFVADFKRDFLIELSIIYHRLRHFPHERIHIYREYGRHPVIKLIKMVHEKYGGNYITIDNISKLFNCNSGTIFEYDNFTTAFVNAAKYRSSIFVPMYFEFFNSLKKGTKPKYNTKYNYFPFKIFSPNIFIMEHMLAIGYRQ
ncbi:MAG: hypothetical protein Satyrvirus9_2 [Satyrvirus sp.]|uniref:Uncharacterized protein n=1 Tax=Satyrvirus sp. TaxID=2487771 RepID=A0A3G5ADI4_9VIRU|nr:MAG: hypothetical protein Satyrvirus9_2 [Satyrvirus sp.]